MAIAKPSVITQGLRGKVGNVVFTPGQTGELVVREYVRPANPRTPAQIAARERMFTATATFHNLTKPQYDAWKKLASASGMRPINLFSALGTKFLQVSPGEPLPLDPPATHFNGESVNVSVTVVAGAIRFTADAANRAGIVTELLLQPLRTSHDTPNPRAYRPQAFVAFTLDSLSFDCPVTLGWFACAYRFVRVASGQATALCEVGIVAATAAAPQSTEDTELDDSQ